MIERSFALHDRAATHFARGELRLAERLGRRALAGLGEQLGPHDVNVAGAAQTLGTILLVRGKLVEAARVARQAAAGARRLPRGDHDVELLRLRCTALPGFVARDRGRYDEAIRTLRRAIAVAARRLGHDHLEVAQHRVGLGSTLKLHGRLASAERCYRSALDVLGPALGDDAPDLVPLYHNLGGLAHARGRHAEAEPWARRALDLTVRTTGPRSLATAIELAALAPILDGLGGTDQLDEAAESYRRALVIFRRIHGPCHYDIALALANLGVHHARRGDRAMAARTLRRAGVMMQSATGRDHPDVGLIRANLAAL